MGLCSSDERFTSGIGAVNSMPFPTQKTVGKYREISENLANPSLLSELRNLFNRRYSLAELLDWIHKTVKWQMRDLSLETEKKP